MTDPENRQAVDEECPWCGVYGQFSVTLEEWWPDRSPVMDLSKSELEALINGQGFPEYKGRKVLIQNRECSACGRQETVEHEIHIADDERAPAPDDRGPSQG